MGKKKRVNPYRRPIRQLTEGDEKKMKKQVALATVQATMNMVAMVLIDNCGFHIEEETEDTHDVKSLRFFMRCMEEKRDSIDSGAVKMRDYETVLREEGKLAFTIGDEDVEENDELCDK